MRCVCETCACVGGVCGRGVFRAGEVRALWREHRKAKDDTDSLEYALPWPSVCVVSMCLHAHACMLTHATAKSYVCIYMFVCGGGSVVEDMDDVKNTNLKHEAA